MPVSASTPDDVTASPQETPGQPSATPPRIVVLGTGGTISCTHDSSGALVPTLSTQEIVDPVVQRFEGNVIVEARDIAQLDSSSITFDDYDTINAAIKEALSGPEVTGVVVTHGTDSMEESAIAADIVHNDSRPVIFTGAQRPADHPEADGPGNLFESIVIATDISARDIGVLIVFGHAVIPARGAVKWHTSDPLAFATNAPDEPPRPRPLPKVTFAGHRVDIIPAYPGADASLLNAAIDAGTEGLVIEGMGAGNVGDALATAITSALKQGIPVVMASRVPRGNVNPLYGGDGGGLTLSRQGVIGAGSVHAGQARIILAAAIDAEVHPQTLFDV